MKPNITAVVWLSVFAVASLLFWLTMVNTGLASVEENGGVENSQVLICLGAMALFLLAGFLGRNHGTPAKYTVLALFGFAAVVREMEPETLPINPTVAAQFDDPGQVVILSLIFLTCGIIIFLNRATAWQLIKDWVASPAGHALIGAVILWVASHGFDNPLLHWEYPEEILEVCATMLVAMSALLSVIQTVQERPRPAGGKVKHALRRIA